MTQGFSPALRTNGGQNRIDEREYNHSEVTSPSYRFGPFLADRVRYRVLRGTEALDVTPKLLDLLFHLLDNAGALITKEQLLDALWPNANVTDNALAQAVSELRDALGDDAGAPQFIKTVARRGYRFVAPVEIVEPDTTQPVKRRHSDRSLRRTRIGSPRLHQRHRRRRLGVAVVRASRRR